MKFPHRIAAGGIIITGNAVLLVRYLNGEDDSFLVAPGGCLNHDENIKQAIAREVFEETGLKVKPKTVVMIEDLICTRFKMCKIWMTCDVVGGTVSKTKGAEEEGITEVGWFTREQLNNEIVFPSILLEQDWNILNKVNNYVVIPLSRRAMF